MVEEKQETTTSVAIVRGVPQTLVKGSDGRFKKQKKMVSTLDVTRALRKLTCKRKPEYNGLTQFENATQKLLDYIEDAYNVDMDDKEKSKHMAVAVQAYKEIGLRAFGKPSASDEEISALQTAGVKFVLIPAPVLMHPEVIVDAPKKPLVPSFIDAEVVSTNEQGRKL